MGRIDEDEEVEIEEGVEEDLDALEDALDEIEGGAGGGEDVWDRGEEVEDESLPEEIGEQDSAGPPGRAERVFAFWR